MKGPKEASLFNCVSSSICLHGSMVVALALAPKVSGLLNEGTSSSQTIEFAVEAPKGQQLTTTSTGPLKQSVDAKQMDTPKPIPQKVSALKAPVSQEDVVIKKPAPPKQESKIEPKAVAKKETLTQKESPVPVAIKEKEDLEKVAMEKELQALREKQQQQEELLAKAAAEKEFADMARLLEEEKLEEARIAKELEQKQILQELEDQRLSEVAAMEAELAREKAENERLANEKKQQEAQMAALRDAKKSSHAQTDRAYGVPSGVRAVTDLRQAPGNIPPQYTELARLRKMQGQGELMYYVTESGHVSQIRLAQSTGYSELDRQAIDAISQYRFYPGQAGWTKHAVIFELKGSTQATGGRLRLRR